MANEDTVDFRPDAVDPSEPSAVFDSSEVELAEAPITWRWGRPADMAALRLCHFQSEVAAGEPLYLPEQPSDQRTIAIAERGGRVIGGMLTEDSIAVTTIGLDPEVIESAAEVVIPAILTVARQEGTRFLQLSLPASLAATLGSASRGNSSQPPSSLVAASPCSMPKISPKDTWKRLRPSCGATKAGFVSSGKWQLCSRT
jgi:hypothetical protein